MPHFVWEFSKYWGAYQKQASCVPWECPKSLLWVEWWCSKQNLVKRFCPWILLWTLGHILKTRGLGLVQASVERWPQKVGKRTKITFKKIFQFNKINKNITPSCFHLLITTLKYRHGTIAWPVPLPIILFIVLGMSGEILITSTTTNPMDSVNDHGEDGHGKVGTYVRLRSSSRMGNAEHTQLLSYSRR